MSKSQKEIPHFKGFTDSTEHMKDAQAHLLLAECKLKPQ